MWSSEDLVSTNRDRCPNTLGTPRENFNPSRANLTIVVFETGDRRCLASLRSLGIQTSAASQPRASLASTSAQKGLLGIPRCSKNCPEVFGAMVPSAVEDQGYGARRQRKTPTTVRRSVPASGTQNAVGPSSTSCRRRRGHVGLERRAQLDVHTSHFGPQVQKIRSAAPLMSIDSRAARTAHLWRRQSGSVFGGGGGRRRMSARIQRPALGPFGALSKVMTSSRPSLTPRSFFRRLVILF